MLARPGLVLAGMATVAYLAFVVPQLDRPLQYDDANFALAARAVAETGLPYGNQGWMSERGDFSQREQWAVWHPPLYVFMLGGLARVGGWAPPVLRLLGLAAGLATAALTYVLARDFSRGPPGMRDLAGGIAVGLVMLCPLVVQSTLILDIDLPLLLPLSLLFVWGFTRLEHTRRAWLLLAPLFGLLLWAKMTNPLALLAVVVVWQVLRGCPRRAVLHGLAIGGGGAALFLGSWLLVARALGMPFEMPFGVNAVQWQDSAEVARRAYLSPGAFIEGLQPSVIWIGPGLVGLGLAGVAVRGASIAGCWQFRRADLLIGLVIVLALGYVNKSAGWFPKYQVAFAPLLAALAAPLVACTVLVRPWRVGALVLFAATLSLLVDGLLVRDSWSLQRTWAIQPAAGAALLLVVVAALGLGALWRTAAAGGLAALTGVALGWSLATNAVQLAAPYSTTYWYGTTGTREAADWLDAHVPEGTYLAAKEVAVRARNQRYVDQDNLVYFLSQRRGFDGTWQGEPLQAVVAWEREPYIADQLNRALPAAGFEQTARFGDYVVYVRRDEG